MGPVTQYEVWRLCLVYTSLYNPASTFHSRLISGVCLRRHFVLCSHHPVCCLQITVWIFLTLLLFVPSSEIPFFTAYLKNIELFLEEDPVYVYHLSTFIQLLQRQLFQLSIMGGKHLQTKWLKTTTILFTHDSAMWPGLSLVVLLLILPIVTWSWNQLGYRIGWASFSPWILRVSFSPRGLSNCLSSRMARHFIWQLRMYEDLSSIYLHHAY